MYSKFMILLLLLYYCCSSMESEHLNQDYWISWISQKIRTPAPVLLHNAGSALSRRELQHLQVLARRIKDIKKYRITGMQKATYISILIRSGSGQISFQAQYQQKTIKNAIICAKTLNFLFAFISKLRKW